MSAPLDGLLSIRAGRVLDAIDAYLAARDARIERERERMIVDRCETPRTTWSWGRFGPIHYYLTRGQAIHELKTRGRYAWCSDWERPRQQGLDGALRLAELRTALLLVGPDAWPQLSTGIVALLDGYLAGEE